MSSLRQCTTCQDVTHDNFSYLLPCLHPTCARCLDDIVYLANHKKRKRPSCVCGETFVQDKLATVPSINNNSALECAKCAECGVVAAYFCPSCEEHFCKPHGEIHPTLRTTKGHVVQLVAELPFCQKHSTETALGFCTHCKLLICADCAVTEHNQPPHLNIALDKMADFVKNNVDKLLEHVPDIDKAIKKYTDMCSQLEKERAESEAKTVDIRNKEKVATLHIEDLQKVKSLVLITQIQANTLASTASTLPKATLLHLQSVISTRASNLQSGVGFMSVPTIFNRISTDYVIVSNGGTTITKNATPGSAYGIGDDGCSSGIRSWRFTIHVVDDDRYNINLGIWNSSDSPKSDAFCCAQSCLVSCHDDHTEVWKGKSRSDSGSSCPLRSGDVILLTVDADQHRLTVNNTTQKWMRAIDQLPPPNPAYYPLVSFYNQSESVTIEAAF